MRCLLSSLVAVQLVLAALVMLTFTLITLKLAPYRHQSDDWITFLVSLVITAILWLDLYFSWTRTMPHNNPKNIEALLLFMNITVLIVQVVNMILMKWGCGISCWRRPGVKNYDLRVVREFR